MGRALDFLLLVAQRRAHVRHLAASLMVRVRIRVRVRVRASAITVTLFGARSNRATLSLSPTLNSYPPLVSRFAFLSDDERTLFPQVTPTP